MTNKKPYSEVGEKCPFCHFDKDDDRCNCLKAFEAGREQGKLEVLDKLIEMIEKTESDDGPSVVCYKKECFEDGICKHELLRLKSQLKEKVKE